MKRDLKLNQTSAASVWKEVINGYLAFPAVTLFCAMKWLQIKHECGSCKTPIQRIDLLDSGREVIREEYPMPTLKGGPDHQPGNTQELALQSLDREFFVVELQKLLTTISARHRQNEQDYEYVSDKRKQEIDRFLMEIEYLNNDALNLMDHVRNVDMRELDAASILKTIHSLADLLVQLEFGTPEEDVEEEPWVDTEGMMMHYHGVKSKLRVPKNKPKPCSTSGTDKKTTKK